MSADAVKVAIRVRPQSNGEKLENRQINTVVSKSDAQICVGKDKKFTYDHVFDRDSSQLDVYNACIKDLVDGVFNGLNATILAYGQTGSGKTYSMGTEFGSNIQPESVGIIPRAIEQIFDTIIYLKKNAFDKGETAPTFSVEAQFIELYNEELIDLLSFGRQTDVKLKEEAGQVVLKNAATVSVKSPDDILEVLKKGVLSRSTASTNMNQQSSRSHAIFSIHVKQEKLEAVEASEKADEKMLAVLTAKLHFVDLAGSERLKRTGATGERAKEGIAINCGLLALGNVINALTDPKKAHIPYRDSKLTRLLQDSLGGNSRTLMIACASPNDVDSAETISTLSYAARAKEIKNRVTVNKDHGSASVDQLKARIIALETELNEYRMKSQQSPLVVEKAITAVPKTLPSDTNVEKENKKTVTFAGCPELIMPFVNLSEDLVETFKNRVNHSIGNKPQIDMLAITRDELIDASEKFRTGIEASLHILQIPSKAKSKRERRDTIFSNGPRGGKSKHRVTTLMIQNSTLEEGQLELEDAQMDLVS